MKNKYLIWLVLAVCLACLPGYGQSSKKDTKRKSAQLAMIPSSDIKVETLILRPPVYALDSRRNKVGSGNISDHYRLWLVNNISFRFGFRSNRSVGPFVFDNARVELYILLNAQSARVPASARWMIGVQHMQCLIGDSNLKNHIYSVSLFLPPPYLYLYFPLENTAPRVVADRGGNSRYDLRRMEGVVIISDRNGRELGVHVFAPRSKLSSRREQQLLAAARELRSKGQGEGILQLWPREKTPWAPLDADRFEVPAVQLTSPSGGAGEKPVPAETEEDPKKGNEE